MIGTVIGDVVGSVYEFDNIRRKDFPLFSEECEATDDSIMAIAVADALQIPVKFIGVGEQEDDLMPFVAEDFVKALF